MRNGLNRVLARVDQPAQLMQRVADQAVALIPGSDGALIGLWDGGPVLTYVCGSGFLEPHVGLELVVDGSLSGVAMRSGHVVCSADTSRDPRVDVEACRRLRVLSSVCVPLVRDGRAFGILNVSSFRRDAFTGSDAEALSSLAEFLGVVIGAAADLDRVTRALVTDAADRPEAEVRPEAVDGPQGEFVSNILGPFSSDFLAARRRIEAVLDHGRLSMVFQPIVELATGTVIGYEALARFHDEPQRTPDVWFGEAYEVGRGVELELAAVGLAVRQLADVPDGCTLAINVGPETIVDDQLVPLFESVDARRIVVEITEHAEVIDYPRLTSALDRLRRLGVQLAVDDTGSGISSLAHILQLSPDVIKLDRALTRGVDEDPARRALAVSLVAFAAEAGAVIIAEGIETETELGVLRSIGVQFGQGYHLGRPGPLDERPDVGATWPTVGASLPDVDATRPTAGAALAPVGASLPTVGVARPTVGAARSTAGAAHAEVGSSSSPEGIPRWKPCP